MRDLEAWDAVLRQVVRSENVFQRTQHERERGAEFMTDVTKKDGLCWIEPCQYFVTLTLALVGTSVRQCYRDLPCRQFEKDAVPLIELETGADPRDQKAGKMLAFHQSNGNNCCRGGRIRPGTAGNRCESLSKIIDDGRGSGSG